MPRIEIPNSKRADLRYTVKQMTKRRNHRSGHCLTFSRNSIRSCGDGATTIASAPAQAGQFAALDYLCRGSHLALADEEASEASIGRGRRLVRLPSLSSSYSKALARRRTSSSSFSPVLRVERFRRGWMRDSCIHHCSRRAGCITKGARPVRRAGIRNRRQQCRTALMLDPTQHADA